MKLRNRVRAKRFQNQAKLEILITIFQKVLPNNLQPLNKIKRDQNVKNWRASEKCC